jgi:hypothetical protein
MIILENSKNDLTSGGRREEGEGGRKKEGEGLPGDQGKQLWVNSTCFYFNLFSIAGLSLGLPSIVLQSAVFASL